MMTSPGVSTVAELRVAAMVGSRIREALAGVCSLRSGLGPDAPHLLLIEATLDGPPAGAVRALLDEAAALGVPSAVWVTDVRGVAPELEQLLRHADAVFATDPNAGSRLGGPSAGWVIGLPDAAAHGALAAEPGPRTGRLGLVVDGGRPWSEQTTPALEAIVRAAGDRPPDVLVCGGGVPGDLPAHLARRAAPAAGEAARIAFIGSCGALITAAPPGASPLYTPPGAFDAAALGTPVVMPASRATAITLPRIGIEIPAQGDPGPLIDAALEAGELVPGRRLAARRAVRHEHTYGHRLATIASAVGLAVLPAVAGLRA